MSEGAGAGSSRGMGRRTRSKRRTIPPLAPSPSVVRKPKRPRGVNDNFCNDHDVVVDEPPSGGVCEDDDEGDAHEGMADDEPDVKSQSRQGVDDDISLLAGSQDVVLQQHLSVVARALPISPVDKKPHQLCGVNECISGCYVARLHSECSKCPNPCIPGDCIVKNGQRWAHVRCATDALRGVPSIVRGFVRIDLDRAIMGAPQRAISLPATRGDDDAAAAGAAAARAADGGGGGNGDDDDNDDDQLGRRVSSDAAVVATVVSDGEDAEESASDAFLTAEQRRIKVAPSNPRELTRVNALAGSGKTTTMALKANYEVERASSRIRVGYFVYVQHCCCCGLLCGRVRL